MKKKLASLLVFALVFTMLVPSFALAAGEDAKGHKYEASIKKLMALGIVAGDAGTGNIRPDDELTRAEFAKIAAYAGGYAKAAELLGGLNTGFKDVKADHWAAGYIALAASKGYLKGDPNKNFRPEDKITVAEAVTVLLRILGYNDNLPGSWPTDYITQAAVLGLFDNVQVAAGAKVKRGEVFALTDAVLNQNLVVYNKDTDRFDLVDGDAGQQGVQTKTLLAASFSDIASGVVTETKAVYGSQLADNKIKVDGVTKELASDVIFQGFTDAHSLLGHTVQYIELGGKVKLLIDATKAENVVSGTIENSSFLTTVTNGVYRVDLKGKDPYTLTDNAVFVRNYQSVAKTAIANGDSATVILNSAGKAQAVIAKKFDAEDLVVNSVTAATNASPARITFTDSTTKALAKDAVVIRNGAKATVADLQKYDVVSYVTAGNDVILVDAVAKTVTGKVTGKKSDGTNFYVAVDGTEYATTSAIYANTTVGSTYTFNLGHSDNIVRTSLVSGESTVVKGILIKNDAISLLDGNVVVPYRQLTFLTLDGKTETRTVLEVTGNTDTNKNSGDTTVFAVGKFGDFTFSKNSSGKDVVTASFSTVGNVKDSAVSFTYDKDTKIAQVNGVNYFVTDSTVVVNVQDSSASKWSVINVADLHNKTGLTAEVVTSGFNLSVVFVQGASIAQASETAPAVYGIVTGKSASVDGEGTAKYFINVNVNGEVKSYELDSDTVYNNVYVGTVSGSVQGKLVSLTDTTNGTVTGKYDTVTSAAQVNVTASADQKGTKVYFSVGGQEYALTSSSVIYVKKTDGTVVLGIYDDIVESLTGYNKTIYLVAGTTDVAGKANPTAKVVKAVLVELTAQQ